MALRFQPEVSSAEIQGNADRVPPAVAPAVASVARDQRLGQGHLGHVEVVVVKVPVEQNGGGFGRELKREPLRLDGSVEQGFKPGTWIAEDPESESQRLASSRDASSRVAAWPDPPPPTAS